MYAIRWALFLSAAGLVACGEEVSSPGEPSPSQTAADTDGDGLSDDESTLGLDPLSADTDGDRLADGLEAEAGCDPLVADSDGDLYLDGDEVARGVDPTDASSWIYQGGWPFNGDKEALGDPGFGGQLQIGARFPDLRGIDQHGQEVHLYDFAGTDKIVMVDFSTEWCPPCNGLADYLNGTNDDWGFPNIREAVQSGEIYWITLMLQPDAYGELPTAQTSASWEKSHPDENIPVLAPLNPAASMTYADISAFPTMMWLNPDLTVVEIDIDAYASMFSLEQELSR